MLCIVSWKSSRAVVSCANPKVFSTTSVNISARLAPKSPINDNISLTIFITGSIIGLNVWNISARTSNNPLNNVSIPSTSPPNEPLITEIKSSIASLLVLEAFSVSSTVPPASMSFSLNSSADNAPDWRTFTISAPFLAPKVDVAILNASV